MAPQIIVQGGSQACRAWVRNVAAMALAADPNRTHQSVRVLGDEVAHIRYTGQGRCTIRIDGGEEAKGVAFQLLHDQQLQPEWYGVSYEGSGFRVRRIAPPQFDRTWYGPGTRKLHWRAGKPPSAAQLEAWAKVRGSSAAGALVAIDEEILAAGAAAGSGTANLLILKGALGAQLQVIARWYSTGSASYQDAPVLAVPAYNGMGEVKRQVMCSSFSPDGLKVVVAGMRAGAVDVTFRAGAAPVLAPMRDADVLPAEFVSFTGGYAREAHTRADAGIEPYLGVRLTDVSGYWVGDACLSGVNPLPSRYEPLTVSKKSSTQRLEIDTLDLHRGDDAADAMMWVHREIASEEHLHELPKPVLRAVGALGDCDLGDGPLRKIKVYVPNGYAAVAADYTRYYPDGRPIEGHELNFITPEEAGNSDAYEALGPGTGYLRVGASDWGAPLGLPDISGPPPTALEYAGQAVPRTSWTPGVSVTYSGNVTVDGELVALHQDYSYFAGQPMHAFYSDYYGPIYWFRSAASDGAGGIIWGDFLTYNGIRIQLGAGSRSVDPDDPTRPSPFFMDDVVQFVPFTVGTPPATYTEYICIVATDDLGMVLTKYPEEHEPSPGYPVRGFVTDDDYPLGQLSQAQTLNSASFVVAGKVAEQVQQLAMTTTTTLATTGSDPYASAVLTVARNTVRGAGTLDDARPTVMFPLAARLLAGARVIDHVAGEMLTRDGLAGALSSSSGFNTPAVRDFSATAALDLDLRLPGWDDALVASLGGRGVVSAPIENAVVKRQVWAFGTLVATVTIQDSAPALASRQHLITSRAFSESELPFIDAPGAAARIADYGLQHIGATGAHGGLRDFAFGYTGSFYGAVSTNVFGYGGADFGLGTYRAQRTPGATLPWYSQFSWAFSPGSTALDGEAISYPDAYGYGTSTDPAFVAPYPGRVCDVAYSQDTSIVVTTARGTAHVAHRTAAGAVVHADLLALLGKAGAAGYSRSWWVVSLTEL